jgi:glycosyltransferase involved in cell wall biosynthesis
MARAIKRIDTINRLACRRLVEKKFTIQKMASNYEKVYRKVLSKKNAKT